MKWPCAILCSLILIWFVTIEVNDSLSEVKQPSPWVTSIQLLFPCKRTAWLYDACQIYIITYRTVFSPVRLNFISKGIASFLSHVCSLAGCTDSLVESNLSRNLYIRFPAFLYTRRSFSALPDAPFFCSFFFCLPEKVQRNFGSKFTFSVLFLLCASV